MNLVQRIISVILHCGHAAKQVHCNIILIDYIVQICQCLPQVYSRLQKMLLCLSHRQTLVALDELGTNHDAAVKQWQASIAGSLSSEVSFYAGNLCCLDGEGDV